MPRKLPALDELPTSFGIFPLEGALLLPGGRLPLNVFETRYLALVEDSLAAGRFFGMIQPDPAAPVGPRGTGLFHIGCLGRLVAFEEVEDGRTQIALQGVMRFAVVRETENRHGYRRVRADLARFAADLAPPAPVEGFNRARLLAALRPYFTARGINANWPAIEVLADEALITTLAMACPFAAAEQQALLEAETPAERARVLATLIEIDTHAPETDSAPIRLRVS
jgi:hypothetical protein